MEYAKDCLIRLLWELVARRAAWHGPNRDAGLLEGGLWLSLKRVCFVRLTAYDIGQVLAWAWNAFTNLQPEIESGKLLT